MLHIRQKGVSLLLESKRSKRARCAGLFMLGALLSGTIAGCGSSNSNSQPPTISVALSAKRGGLAVTQAIPLTASVQNDSGNQGVTWLASGANCAGTACGTFANITNTAAVYTAPVAAGVYSVIATSVADPTKSASASFGVTDLAGVLTYHNDLARDGANTQEYALTPSNVNTAMFGKLFSCAVDGAVYAQPLWVPNLAVKGAKHNVLFVATAHDSAYAFDADASPCVLLWHANLLDVAHGGTSGEITVPSSGPGALVGLGYGDITPEVGVIGTPVINASTETIYMVSKSVLAGSTFFQRLHALDLLSGDEKFGGPMLITASVAGTGDGSSSGNVGLDPRYENNRAGLVLANGIVYISWASHEDASPYHGWVLAYDEATLAQMGTFNSTPNGGLGGIWQSGAAPAVDATGSIYLATGNGTFNTSDAYGDSILRINPPSGGNITVADSFTPDDQGSLNQSDIDLGAGGVVLLPDLPSGVHQHLLVQVGKSGTVYLVDRANMGGYCNGCGTDTNIVQELHGVINGHWGIAAYWNGSVYVCGTQFNGANADHLKAFSFNAKNSGLLSTSPSSMTTTVFSFSSPVPAGSASGATNGIVWGLDNSQFGPPNQSPSAPTVLHAYNANSLGMEYWNSGQAEGSRDVAGNAVKFTVPTIANGKVYVGTRTEIDVYGLLPN